jgi:hypothetical protein
LKSKLMNLPDSINATSLLGLEDGPLPCGGQDSKALPESGPAPVRVSRFRALASDRATQTSATFGPLFTRSSPSGDLQRCLASRLRARMDVNGSPEFALTWKDWDMPAGEPICALRASERRTGDKGCSGVHHWSTPTVQDAENNAGPSQFNRNTHPLNVQATLAAWPTPQAIEQLETSEAKTNRGAHAGLNLSVAAKLAAWPTPNTMEGGQTSPDGKRKGEPLMGGLVGWATPRAEDAESAGMRHSRGVADTLTAQAGQGLPLAGWSTPRVQDCRGENMETIQARKAAGMDGGGASLVAQAGLASTSCPAGTGKRGELRRGVLNPFFSCWLMGYGVAWFLVGVKALKASKKGR